MALVDINWHPDAKELRKFGIAMIVGFALIGGFFFWKEMATAAYVLWAIGAVAGLLGLTGTRVAMIVYVPWMGIALVMGNIVSRVILAVIYYGLITPMSLIMLLVRRDKLHLRPRQVATYWIDAANPDDEHDYERQF